MYDSKEYTLQQIKEETGISKSTLYRYLDQFKQKAKKTYNSFKLVLK